MNALDQWAAEFSSTLIADQTAALWNLSTWLGDSSVLLLLSCGCVWLWRRSVGVQALGLLCLGGMLSGLLKPLLQQPRPFQVTDAVDAWSWAAGFGMPSGHTLAATLVWGCVGLALLSRLRPVALIALGVPALVAASRVVLGVHSLTQVLAGFLLGVVILILLRYARQLLHRLSSIALIAGASLLAVAQVIAQHWVGKELRVPEAWLQRTLILEEQLAESAGRSVDAMRPVVESANLAARFAESDRVYVGALLVGLTLVLVLDREYPLADPATLFERAGNLLFGGCAFAVLVLVSTTLSSWPLALWAMAVIAPIILLQLVPRSAAWIASTS